MALDRGLAELAAVMDNPHASNVNFAAARIVGDEKLQQVLQELGQEHRLNSILKAAMTDVGNRIVVPQLHAAAPRSKGRWARWRRSQGFAPLNTLMAVSGAGRRSQGVAVRIGAIYPAGAQAHLVDLGTEDRFLYHRGLDGNRVQLVAGRTVFKANARSKKGRGWLIGRATYAQNRAARRGRVTAQQWVARAWDRIISEVLEELSADVIARWEKLSEKLDGKADREMAKVVAAAAAAGKAGTLPTLRTGTLHRLGRISARRAGRGGGHTGRRAA